MNGIYRMSGFQSRGRICLDELTSEFPAGNSASSTSGSGECSSPTLSILFILFILSK